MRYMNLKWAHLYVCLFKDILKIEFAKNIHDTIKYSMASIQKKTVDEFFWSAGIRNTVSQHLEVTGWPRRLIAGAFQQAPGSHLEHETLLGQGHRAKVLEASVCLTTCIAFWISLLSDSHFRSAHLLSPALSTCPSIYPTSMYKGAEQAGAEQVHRMPRTAALTNTEGLLKDSDIKCLSFGVIILYLKWIFSTIFKSILISLSNVIHGCDKFPHVLVSTPSSFSTRIEGNKAWHL